MTVCDECVPCTVCGEVCGCLSEPGNTIRWSETPEPYCTDCWEAHRETDGPWITEPGVYLGLDEVAYHSDLVVGGSLSSTGAKTILKAPALFRHRLKHPETKLAYDEGTAIHVAILDDGYEKLYVAPYDSWQTKTAQEERRLAYAEGWSPILPKTWETAARIGEAVREHRLASRLLDDADTEVSMFAQDPDTGVWLRGRADALNAPVMVDVKSTANSDPRAFARDAAKYGYHIQAGFYLHLSDLLGLGVTAFAHLLVEKDPPHLVEVVELDEPALDRGRELARRAMERYRDCMSADRWPGRHPDDTFTTVSLPAWAFYDDED